MRGSGCGATDSEIRLPPFVIPTSMAVSSFAVGGVSVQLAGERPADVALVPSLAPFAVGAYAPDIHILIERVARLALTGERHIFDSGSVWRLYADESRFQFDFSAEVLGARPYKRLLVDRKFCWATLQINEEIFDDGTWTLSPLDYPLDELLIMHRLTQEKAIELHGAGIVQADGVGNLFVGHSEAGKSTTTRLWTAREDVEVLSDDRIIVRRDEASPCATDVEGGVGILRLRDRSASPAGYSAPEDNPEKRIPHRALRPVRNDKKMRMYGTPWHGEAMYASPNSAPLARIFILEHGSGNVLTPLSSSQAVAELFARSFVPFHRHEYVESALAFLQEVVEAVPVYRYAFEPDQRAVDTILNLHD